MATVGAQPETRYAKSGDVHVAYQVLGDGPIDLVFVPGLASHLDLQWEEPLQASFFRQLASFSRLIRFDKRGQGLSDRVSPMPGLDERMDDIRAVMDAVGSERAALMAISEGGPISIVFAATYPERTEGLILLNSHAMVEATPERPWGLEPDRVDPMLDFLERSWGSGLSVEGFVPSGDDAFRSWWGRFERSSVTPGAMVEAWHMDLRMDVRPVLRLVQTRTLVLHSTNDRLIDVEEGRYLAREIPGATFVEVPGMDHFPWPEGRMIAAEVEQFLTGTRRAPEIDRVLATVLFTDIVGSTQRAAEVGDRRWRDLLDSHHHAVRRQLEHFRGREVKTIGDGFLATFDGPARAVRCALEVRDQVRTLGLEVRSGIHTGECEIADGDVSGIAVHIGSRVASVAGEGEVLVSSTVKDLVTGSEIEFSDRGRHA
ncbi:MAG: adenylate/guanylate cyclase domain-containing protein, partial [Candidatus Dormibacteraeota bacterium]|nr:adenylate/guanylate cyclase domain-containing protein [Candidatus Dormibacteraeota bacterium]